MRSVTPRRCFSSILHSLSFSLLSFPFPQSSPSSKVPCKGNSSFRVYPRVRSLRTQTRCRPRDCARDGCTRNTRPACPRNERVLLFNPLRTLSDYSTCAAAAAALSPELRSDSNSLSVSALISIPYIAAFSATRCGPSFSSPERISGEKGICISLSLLFFFSLPPFSFAEFPRRSYNLDAAKACVRRNWFSPT